MRERIEFDVELTTVDKVTVVASNIGEAKRKAKEACARMERVLWASFFIRRELGSPRVTRVKARKS